MDKTELIYTAFCQSKGISIDTRTLCQDELFFAISGQSFDANLLIDDALARNPFAVVTSNALYNSHPKCFVVHDTLKALHELAKFHRKKLKAKIIGITGTNGKTTSKELIREALSTIGEVSATKGNLNNHIGVPLTILSISYKSDFAIVEMGANHIGEIAQLCELADPEFGIITNIGKAHLEGFGSFEGIIKAKSELYLYIINKSGFLFVNEDDDLLMKLSESANSIKYGKSKFRINNLVTNPNLSFDWVFGDEKLQLQSKMPGLYNISNFLAAITIGLHFGGSPVKINTALSKYVPSINRSQWIDSGKNRILMDAYNANPSSMSAALQSFALLDSKEKCLILGDMRELGDNAHVEHMNVLNQLMELELLDTILIGPIFSALSIPSKSIHAFCNVQDCIDYLKSNPISKKIILLKGSRGMKLETIIPAL